MTYASVNPLIEVKQPFYIPEMYYGGDFTVPPDFSISFLEEYGHSLNIVKSMAAVAISGIRLDDERWQVIVRPPVNPRDLYMTFGRIVLPNIEHKRVLPLVDDWIRYSDTTLQMPGIVMELKTPTPDTVVRGFAFVQTQSSPTYAAPVF